MLRKRLEEALMGDGLLRKKDACLLDFSIRERSCELSSCHGCRIGLVSPSEAHPQHASTAFDHHDKTKSILSSAQSPEKFHGKVVPVANARPREPTLRASPDQRVREPARPHRLERKAPERGLSAESPGIVDDVRPGEEERGPPTHWSRKVDRPSVTEGHRGMTAAVLEDVERLRQRREHVAKGVGAVLVAEAQQDRRFDAIHAPELPCKMSSHHIRNAWGQSRAEYNTRTRTARLSSHAFRKLPKRKARRDVGVGQAAADRTAQQVQLVLSDAVDDGANAVERGSNRLDIVHIDPAPACPMAKLAAHGRDLSDIPSCYDDPIWKFARELCSDASTDYTGSAYDQNIGWPRHVRSGPRVLAASVASVG